MIPQSEKILEYYSCTYACDKCEKDTGFAHIITTKTPPPLMKHSLASPSTVADVMTKKYVDGVPLARQCGTGNIFGKVDGVRVLTPHSCRHTYVSQMQALGVDLPTIQSIVGHADVDMTEHYLRVQEPKRLEAIELFSKAFGIHQE